MEHRVVVKEALHKNKVQIALIQETKICTMSDRIVREGWGSRNVNWEDVDAVGSTGVVNVFGSQTGKYYVSIMKEDVENKSKWMITSVYGPHSAQSRVKLWKDLDDIRCSCLEWPLVCGW